MKIGTLALDAKYPVLMGIVNATPDSFSDGGKYEKPSAAIDHAIELVEDGADIIDLGGESTRPGACPVSAPEELRRVMPVIEGIRRRSSIPISIDTTKASVASRALDAGADMINDISAGRCDPEMFALVAQRGVPICLMHMQGEPRTMQLSPRYDDVVGEIRAFLGTAIDRAVTAGVDRGKVIVDPGIGFGKSAEDNVVILKNLKVFLELEAPILIGTSRKSFMGKLLGYDVEDRLEATLATLTCAVDRGGSLLRVHDVGAARRFLDMYRLCR